jgi:di/tricarboxylate transporter
MARDGDEKLWRYADLARLWSLSLIGVAVALLGLAVALQAGSTDGLDARWFATAFGVAGITGIILYPLFRVWLRKSLPSARLPDADRAGGTRRLEATPRDWRRWSILTAVVLFVGGAAMMIFLIAVLGNGGTAEGVVAGVLAAWGAATLHDVRRIRLTEQDEGRRYYAACERPVGAGNHLVWMRAADG